MKLRPPAKVDLGSSPTGQVQFMFRNLVLNPILHAITLFNARWFSMLDTGGETAASQFTQKDTSLGSSIIPFNLTLTPKVCIKWNHKHVGPAVFVGKLSSLWRFTGS